MRKLVFIALLILGLPNAASSQTIRYLDCGCSKAGDGTLSSCRIGNPGGPGAYDTPEAFDSGEGADITAAGSNTIIELRMINNAAPSAATRCPRFVLNDVNWVTDSTHYIHITANPGEEATVPITSVIPGFTTSGSGETLDIRVPDVRISKIYVENTGAVAGCITYDFQTGTQHVQVEKTVMNCGGAGFGIEMDQYTGTGWTADFYNNVVYNVPSGIRMRTRNNATISAYHNTIDATSVGFHVRGTGTGDTVNIRNNICSDATNCYYDSLTTLPNTVTCTNNVDTGTPDSGLGCTSSTTSWTKDYVAEGSNNFHINTSLDGGADLTSTVADDIDAQSRTTTPDQGADEVAGSSGVVPVPQTTSGNTQVLSGGTQ